MVEVAVGDLPSARAVLAEAAEHADPESVAAMLGLAWDLGWVLDDSLQRVLLGLRPEAFGGDRAAWGLALAQVHAVRGADLAARAYADSAHSALAVALRGPAVDPQLHALEGVALAYLGEREAAVRAGRRAVKLVPLSRDAYSGAYFQHQLARILVLTGDHDQALDALEPLLRRPYFLSPGWLRVDPTFAPLRGHPRFQRLLHEY